MLTAAGVHGAVFVGTSRGGLITMALSALRPALVRGAVLNDIGPVIDGTGLVRIRGYVGKMPQPRSFAEGAEILRELSDSQFPRLDAAAWEAMARTTWIEENGRLVPAYDPQLMKILEAIDIETPLPALWHLFEGLRNVPILALRGAISDLLSSQTLKAMSARHPYLDDCSVSDLG